MPAFVQVVATGTVTASNPLVLTLGAVTTTVNNTLLLGVRETGGKTLIGVTDSKGNVWNVDVPGTAAGSGCSAASAPITTPLVPSDTITLTFSATCTPIAGVAEFSGVGVSGAATLLDQTADLVNAAGLTVAPELALATTTPGELAWTVVGGSSALPTWAVTTADPDSGGTWVPVSFGVGIGAAYQLVPATLTKVKATWTAPSGTTNCEGVIATYGVTATAKSDTEASAAGAEGTPKTGVNDAVGFP